MDGEEIGSRGRTGAGLGPAQAPNNFYLIFFLKNR